jgi:hypothetical protein
MHSGQSSRAVVESIQNIVAVVSARNDGYFSILENMAWRQLAMEFIDKTGIRAFKPRSNDFHRWCGQYLL